MGAVSARGGVQMRWAIGLALVTVASTARANPLEIYGFDPRAVGMGGAQVAAAEDFTAAFYNPSLLVLRRDVGIGIGFTWARPAVSADAVVPADQPRLDALALKPGDAAGYTLGVLFPIGGRVRNRVALGLGVYHPVVNLLRLEAHDRSTPTWYLYQSAADRIVVVAGLGVRVHDFFLVGVGVQALADLRAQNDFAIDLFNKRITRRDVNSNLVSTQAPVAGATALLLDGALRLSAAWRSQMQLKYSLPTTIDLGEVGKLVLTISGYTHWSPHEFVFGAQYAWRDFTLTGEVAYALWDQAPNPYVRVGLDVGGAAIDALGLGKVLDLDTDAEDPPSPGFLPVLVPRVGVEYRVAARFVARVGYALRPTPVPDQTASGNLLDGTTHVLGAGFGAAVDDPLEVFERSLHFELGAQILLLRERTAQKASDSPVPSYRYGGRVLNLAVALRYEF